MVCTRGHRGCKERGSGDESPDFGGFSNQTGCCLSKIKIKVICKFMETTNKKSGKKDGRSTLIF
jgi:hypothetical protein